MRGSFARVGLVVVFAPLVAAAAPDHVVDGTPRVLSFDQAIALGVAKSPLVRRAEAERQVAEAGRVGAGVLLPVNPYLSANLGRRRDVSGSLPPATGLEWGLRLELPIEIANQRGTRLREADRLIDVARRREQLAKVEARARIASVYVSLQLAREAADSSREFEGLGERLLASARARMTAGASSDVEVRLAEAELGRLRHQRMEAELAAVAFAAELRQWLLLPPGSPVDIEPRAGAPAPIERSLEDLIAEARQQRQDLNALVASGGALDAQIVRLRREVVPNPVLMAEVAQQQPGQTYAGGGLGIALPIFARNQGAIAIARAEQKRVEAEVDLVRRGIDLEVATLFEVVRIRRGELAIWQDEIVPAATASAQLVETGWRAGKFDLYRVVQVQREANEARRKRLEVLAELWGASINLLRSVGMP